MLFAHGYCDDTIKDMTNRKLLFFPFLGAVLAGYCLSCAAPAVLKVSAPVRETPSAAVSFDRIEAGDANHVTLFFLLDLRNPRQSAARLTIQDWKAAINGVSPG